MTDLSNEVREVPIDELPVYELDAVSGGEIQRQIPGGWIGLWYDAWVASLHLHIYTGPLK
jgi:hypothetical protein